jgi:hypothetical protein
MATATVPTYRPTEQEIQSWLSQQFHSELPVPFAGIARQLLTKAYLKDQAKPATLTKDPATP